MTLGCEENLSYQTDSTHFSQMREAGETRRFDEPEEILTSADEFDLGRYHRYDLV